jgi:nitrile hydratase accessory protein
VTLRAALIDDADGPLAIPRSNGELLFNAPWESSAFALAIALDENGLVDRAAFRLQLIAEIDEWQRTPEDRRPAWDYYGCWLRAVEAAVLAHGLVHEGELRNRVAELAEHDQHG